jgi:hypothetical protein
MDKPAAAESALLPVSFTIHVFAVKQTEEIRIAGYGDAATMCASNIRPAAQVYAHVLFFFSCDSCSRLINWFLWHDCPACLSKFSFPSLEKS